MQILILENIIKSFGKNMVLKGAKLSFDEGKIYSIIGNNGAGKTTLYNLITGFLRVDEGTITFRGQKIQNTNPSKINNLGIVRTFQDLRLIPGLSVRENILLACKNNPGEKIFNALLPPRFFKEEYREFNTRVMEILKEINLIEVADNLASDISYGQQKLLTIGCCIANDAELLLLDEPIAGIDKENYSIIYDLALQLKEKGKTIIQIEHNHRYVESLSDEIYFLNGGIASLYSNYGEFKSDPTIKEVYLD